MKASAVVDFFRSDVQDLAEPRLWSDVEAFGYLDDAQTKFCREAGGLGDATTAKVTQLAVKVGFDVVKTHESILKIRSAYRLSDGRKVKVINFEDLERLGLRFDGTTGEVMYLVIGLEAEMARFWPVPAFADTVQLVVDRMPLCTISDETPDEELEIARQHQRPLTMWMRHLAYGKQDSEGYDKKKSIEFEGRFLNYCATAKAEKARAMHKTRITAYGGY